MTRRAELPRATPAGGDPAGAQHRLASDKRGDAMGDSTTTTQKRKVANGKPEKPKQPYPEFPLFPHASGRRAKTMFSTFTAGCSTRAAWNSTAVNIWAGSGDHREEAGTKGRAPKGWRVATNRWLGHHISRFPPIHTPHPGRHGFLSPHVGIFGHGAVEWTCLGQSAERTARSA